MADSEARHSADSARDDQSPADAAADGHAAEARAQIQSLPREGPGAGFSYLRRYTGKDFNTGAFAGYHRPSEDDEDDEGDYAHDEEAPDAAAGGTLKASDGTAPANAPPAVVKRRKSKKAPEWKNTLMLTYACLGCVGRPARQASVHQLTTSFI